MVYVVVIYLVMSVITFVVYWWDKRAAVRSRRRVRERTLHVLALLGGVPGAVVAQQVVRHKRCKIGFMAVTILIVILHISAWGLWLWWRVEAHVL